MKIREKIKKVSILCLIFLLSINSFATSISNNDGSAFITKAEFDALKSSFQSQIDTYNQGIDSKIDNAIASYLAGIKIKRNMDLKCLLDKDGKYGDVKEYWSSSTTGTYDKESKKYLLEDFTMGHIKEVYSKTTRFLYPIPTGTDAATEIDKRNYVTSMNNSITLDDGSIVSDAFKRVRAKTLMTWSYYEIKTYRNKTGTTVDEPGYHWNPNSPYTAMNNHAANIKQGTAGYLITVQTSDYIDWTTPGQQGSTNMIEKYANYYAIGSLSIQTKSDDTFNLTEETIYPLSEANDYYWNTQDKTSYITNENYVAPCDATKLSNWDTCVTEGDNILNNVNEKPMAWGAITPQWYLKHHVPWMANSKKHNQTYLTHWNAVSNKNRTIKHGLYLGMTTVAGDLKIKCNAEKPGKLYLYIGDAAVTNWKETSFVGKVYNISAENTDCEFTYEDAPKDKNIYCLFLPTSDSVKSLLKIKEMYQVSET